MICSICLEKIHNKEKLECNHCFCKSCIDTWKKTSHTCPMCRAYIYENKINKVEFFRKYQGFNIYQKNLYGFKPTLSKYLNNNNNLSLCLNNNHKLIISKPFGIIIECKECNKYHCFNWLG